MYCSLLVKIYSIIGTNDHTISRLSIEEVQTRVNKLGILETLQSEPDKFCGHMTTYVYPSLDGTDHLMLTYYYQTMQPCTQPLQGELTADSHVKLLKKLKSVAEGMVLINFW